MRKRCKCHPRDMYATLVECPKCHHWSFDDMADDYGACERRKCGYERKGPRQPEQLGAW